MALIPSSRYPAQTDADAGYPQGKARNAGSLNDGTGTPLEKDWVNDQFGFHQALLAAAGITPSGTPDTALASQYLTALTQLTDEANSKASERVQLANWVDGGEIVAFAFLAITWAEAWGVFITTSAFSQLYKSPDGAIWTLVGSILAAAGLAVNPAGIGIAVGAEGAIARSVDGTTWTTPSSGTANGLRAVTWGSVFVAVGDAGKIITSTDGTTWTARTSGVVTMLLGVASSGSLTVVVGNSGVILTSPDGITWTARTSGVAVTLKAATWTGSLFVVVGDTGTILTSPDGITWTARTSGVTTYLSAITTTDNYVIAMGSAGVLLFSNSGVAWQRILHTSDSGAFAASGVAWNGRVCVASGSQSGHGRISRSLMRLPP